MKAALESLLKKSLDEYSKDKGFSVPAAFDFGLVVTKDPTHGDFASNAAFRLAKLAQQKPPLIADDLSRIILETQTRGDTSVVERIEVAGGGFLNFYLSKASMGSILKLVRDRDQDYGKSEAGAGQKVLLEYVSANPTGPLTIAHGRQAAIGDSLARIMTYAGYKVSREYYLNDAGRQMRLLGQSLWARYQQAKGSKVELPEDGYQGEYLIEMAKELLHEEPALEDIKESEAIDSCRLYAGEKMMKTIGEDLAEFSVSFDQYFSESTLYDEDEVEQAFTDLKKGDHLYEEDGALWFRTTDFGDDKDRVVRKSSGEMTYLAPDIAYHRNKFKRGFQWLVNFLGPDHHGYVARLKASCQALGYDAKQLDVRIVQLVSLFRAGEPMRMSTRKGQFVTLRELIDEVGKDAARFFFVMRRVESQLDFDLELAKQKSQDNPVYYLQYAHARIASMLRLSEQSVDQNADLDLLKETEENELIKKISDFPGTLARASETLEPYRVVDYLRELAAMFHKFYAKHRVLSDDVALTQARLYLCDATRIVMRNGLEMLGISQPESM